MQLGLFRKGAFSTLVNLDTLREWWEDCCTRLRGAQSYLMFRSRKRDERKPEQALQDNLTPGAR